MTVQSIVNWIQYGLPESATAASNIRTPTNARSSPNAPPMNPSTMLSTSSWRTTRQREAPSAILTAISRARVADRDNRRLATFAHAISSTNPTAPIIARKICLISPPLNRSLNVCTSAEVSSLLVSGCCAAEAAARPSSSACAWARDASARRRPNTWSGRSPRVSFAPGRNGIQIADCVGNIMPSGMTPTIVAGSPFTRRTRPSTPRSAPYRFFQMPWPMMTTRSAPRASSPGAKSRPRSGCCPSTLNALAVRYVPRACSGNPRSSARFMLVFENPAIAANVRLCGAPFLELDEGERVRAAVRRPLRTEHVELRRVLERQALDEDRVHEREHGGVHADAEREGRHRDRGEPSLLGDETEREAKIVEQAHTDLHTYEPAGRLTESRSWIARPTHGTRDTGLQSMRTG